MLTLLSPAKDLNMDPVIGVKGATKPELLADAELLHGKLKDMSAKQLAKLMDINPKLSELNHDRYQEWAPPFTARNSKTAIHAFNGEVYRGLDAGTLDAADLDFAQHHLRILSGLYGVLRPKDRMQAYRLEMGTKLSMGRGKKDLYAFWDDRITASIARALKASGSDVLINLASQEYFKAVRPELLDARVITPVFKDRTAGGFRVVMVFAKQQRGRMARHIIQHRLMEPEPLKMYREDGYHFSPEESTGDQWVFLRDSK